jgi:plasmid maintenance system antidote protein VapI
LLTREDVIAALMHERVQLGLTATAEKYSLAPQQICDVLAGRARLSKRMVKKLSYKIHCFFEKVEED